MKYIYITNRQEIAAIAQGAGVDRICVDMEFVGSVFQIIFVGDRFSWELVWLSDRNETDLQFMGNRTAEDESSGFRTGNDLCADFLSVVDQHFTCLMEGFPISHQRRDIAEQHTGLRKIRNGCNIIFEIQCIMNYFSLFIKQSLHTIFNKTSICIPCRKQKPL